MWEIAGFLSDLGNSSLSGYWLPVALWSGLALFVYALLRLRNRSNIAYQYHGRAALLLALPIGLGASYLTTWMQETMKVSQSELSAKFIIIQSPISLPAAEPVTAAPAVGFEWSDPMIWIGLLMAVIITISLQQVVLLLLNLNGLRQFARSLDSRPLSTQFRPQIDELRGMRRVRIAYSGRIEVPFTFGCFRPVIVLPEHLRGQEEKRLMSIRHELTHIKHSDYALNVLLLLAEALFWFHPMVYILHREVYEYREISCDREVLSYSSISRRKYAELLLELAPRPVFQQHPTIGMSVQPNTLRKRIEIMQSYNRSNAPLRSSLLLTLVTSLFVTGIMACTDLQRANSAAGELRGGRIALENAEVVVNGTPYITAADTGGGVTLSGPARGLAAITLGSYGTIIFSAQEFGDAEPAGSVSGSTVTIDLENIEVVIRSKNPVTGREEARIWAVRDIEFTGGETDGQPRTFYSFLPDWETYENYRQSRRVSLQAEMNVSDATERDFFIAVEQEPQLIGGLRDLQARVAYPERVRRAGIEGQVIIQFIVDEQGEVENPEVIRSVHPLLDQAAVNAVLQHATFIPGRQQNRPVRVQFSLPIIFRLTNEMEAGSGAQPPPGPTPGEENADPDNFFDESRDHNFSSNGYYMSVKDDASTLGGVQVTLSDDGNPELDAKAQQAEEELRRLESARQRAKIMEARQQMGLINGENAPELDVRNLSTSGGTLSGQLVDARTGDYVPTANILVMELNRGTVSRPDGTFSLTDLPAGTYTVRITFVGYETHRQTIRIER